MKVQRLQGDPELLAEVAELSFLRPHHSPARRTFAGVSLKSRPPRLPRAQAATSPATVRSEMRARSNSARVAKIPKIPKTSLPDAIVASNAGWRRRCRSCAESFRVLLVVVLQGLVADAVGVLPGAVMNLLG